MKIAITNSSQKLIDLLSEDQKKIMVKNRNTYWKTNVILQNDWDLSEEKIYVSFWHIAIVWESLKIIPEGILSFDETDLNEINIVSEKWNNFLIVETN